MSIAPPQNIQVLYTKKNAMKNLIFISFLTLVASCTEANYSSESPNNQNVVVELPAQKHNFKNGTVEMKKGYLSKEGTLICPNLTINDTESGRPLSVAIKWELYNNQGKLFASLMSDKCTAEKGVFDSGTKTFEVTKKVPEAFLSKIKFIKAKVVEAAISRQEFASWAW